VQLNDTHPAIAVAELMRLLVDDVGMEWGRAWDITRRTFGYTNHTLLPEALERWPLAMFQRLLPRHLEIIYEINARFLDEVRIRFWDDEARVARLSLIDEQGERYVRMANLACVGSHAINGVAELHSELLTRDVLATSMPVAEVQQQDQRRHAAPLGGARQSAARAPQSATPSAGLAHDLDQLAGLERSAGTPASARAGGRSSAQQGGSAYARRHLGVSADPQSRCSTCRSERIHEYKRQHLNILRDHCPLRRG
jgi:starch phosphorylase